MERNVLNGLRVQSSKYLPIKKRNQVILIGNDTILVHPHMMKQLKKRRKHAIDKLLKCKVKYRLTLPEMDISKPILFEGFEDTPFKYTQRINISDTNRR